MASSSSSSSSHASQLYASRIPHFTNPAARHLLECIERKKSNLAVSVDVTTKAELLAVVEAVAEDVCMVKTHIDIVEDFDHDLVERLSALSKEKDFVIFEDRKFADIGNTVSLQYSSGVHRIASWSHITNAHLVPGPGIIDGLASVGVPLGRGLLLLAEMSSKGNLAGGEYGAACVRAAREDTTGFTCGFIAMDRIHERNPSSANGDRDFLILTPGVGLDVTGDGKGQQYRTPDEVVRVKGCDVIIVGRGIYGSLLTEQGKKDPQHALRSVKEQAERYKQAGWEAYQKRIGAAAARVRPSPRGKRAASPSLGAARSPAKRRLFVPTATASAQQRDPPLADTSGDAALAASLEAGPSSNSPGSRSYTLRTRSQVKREEGQQARPSRTRTRSTAASAATSMSTTTLSPSPSKQGRRSIKLEGNEGAATPRAKPASSSSPFSISPQKTNPKSIKLELDASEIKPAPKRWRAQLDVLAAQRRRIVAPVDTMGCEALSSSEADPARGTDEGQEDRDKRARFTTLVSLMLSSQTKDEVTAQAVRNLQKDLPNGLCLRGILEASDQQISTAIAKVGFWRRKTGYIRSAALILQDKFGGDVPRTVEEVLTLPGVGPKMAFLTLQAAWGLNVGIGVDVHVHRLSNRLGWCKTNDPEGTRLVLQSWLPKELHQTINKTLVGFGQVVCVPVGPRCDLCELGKERLCPSRRKVGNVSARKEVVFLDEERAEVKREEGGEGGEIKVKVEVQGPDGTGVLLPQPTHGIKEEQDAGEGSAASMAGQAAPLDW